MRRFIYLDTDVLNSYLAQIDDGLLDSQEIESQLGDSAVVQMQHSIDVGGSADFKLFGKGLEGKIEYIFERMKSNEQSDVYKDVKTKKLHDNAFNKFISHLELNKLLDNEMHQVGSFIKFNGQLSFIDLEYLSSQFKQNGLIEFIKKSQADEIGKKMNEEVEALPREQKRSKEAEIKKYIKQAIADSNAEYDNIQKIIEMLKRLIPYKNVIASGDYLIAASEKFFRDNPEIIAFKYGGHLSIVGFITNIICGDEETPDNSNDSPLATIQPMINKMITMLFNSQKTMYLIHPIAIYYE